MPLELRETADTYVLTHVASGACCAVSRSDGSVSLPKSAPEAGVPTRVHAVLGLLQQTTQAALILVTGRERVATAPCGAPLWRVTRTEMRFSALSADVGDAATDAQYVSLLRVALAEPGLLYASRADATRSAQAGAQAGAPPADVQSRWSSADTRTQFAWNAHLAAPFLAAGAAAFVPPVVCGWGGEVALPGTELLITLLLRRHMGRPGMRLWARGLNANGDAAACVESEQLLRLRNGDGAVAATTSHAQLRASVPLLWSQPPCLLSKPPLTLALPERSALPYRAHMASLCAAYGSPVLCLNLLKAHGREAALGDAYAAATASESSAAKRVEYVHFDFNARGGASEQGRAALLAVLEPHVQRTAFYHAKGGTGDDPELKVLQLQSGALRTNCLDCLDRTNMAQSALGGAVAARQLDALGVADAATRTAALSSLALLWRSAGDAASRQYTGTPAQRRDRSAPPSLKAALDALRDGVISVARYVLNNHADGRLCDAAMLISGAHVPRRGASPFPVGGLRRAQETVRRTPALQTLLLLCVARTLAAARAVPLFAGDATMAGASAAAWLSAALAVVHVARTHGAAFVNRPLLAPHAVAEEQPPAGAT